MKKYLFLFTLLISVSSLNAQSIIWEKCFGGSQEDILQNTGFGNSNLLKTSDNNYVTAGTVLSNDGNISANYGMKDIWVIKFNTNGNLIWQKNFGGTNNDEANKVIETSDNGLLIVGHTSSADGDVTNYKGGYDLWVIKLDAAGNLEWQRTFGGSGNETGTAAIQDGNFYIITGGTASNDVDVSGHHLTSSYDVWTIKIDLLGNLIWQKCLGGTGTDTAVDLVKTAQNEYVICASTNSNNGDVTNNIHDINNQPETWIVKLDSLSNIIYEKCYGGTSQENGIGIINDVDGNFVVLASAASVNGDVTNHHGSTIYSDYWVMKINQVDGSIIWQTSLGGSGEDYPAGISLASDGAYLINGRTASTNGDVTSVLNGGDDYWIVKLASNLNIDWNYCMGTIGYEWGISIIEDQPGCYIMNGNGWGNTIVGQGGYDFWTLKMCDVEVGINKSVKYESNFTVSPNPMNSQTIIKSTSTNLFFAELYDVMGQKIWNSPYSSNNQISIQRNNLPNGTYLIKIIDQQQATISTQVLIIND